MERKKEENELIRLVAMMMVIGVRQLDLKKEEEGKVFLSIFSLFLHIFHLKKKRKKERMRERG